MTELMVAIAFRWIAVLPLLVMLLDTVAAASLVTKNVISRQAQNLNAPSASNFVNRYYHAALALGGVLYIDGGSISFYDDGGVLQHLPDNNTYSIDLSQDWTNATVSLTGIQKTAPVLCNSHLWADRTNQVMYAFGGELCRSLTLAESPPVPPTSLWRFKPNNASGSHLGSWAEVTGISGFESITRPVGGSSTVGDGAAFLLGGYSTGRSSSETTYLDYALLPLPGMLSYNFTTNTFSNHSALNFNEHGTTEFGEMHYVALKGSSYGIVAAFGGDFSKATMWVDNGEKLRSFSTIHLYDPVRDLWMNQTTSGTIPEPRDRFCSVGLQGDNGTYEIFIFGGHVASDTGDAESSNTAAKAETNIARDEVFLLTLPGFNWQKANYPPSWPRIGHTCNIIGKRQMAVVGGQNPASLTETQRLSTEDPWTNGIGIFDLSAMQWTDHYDATAKSYTSPQVVKDWYLANGGLYPQTWTDSNLEHYFVGPDAPGSSTGSATNNAGSSTGDSTGNTGGSASNSGSGSSSNTGAIVGGVVGGIGGALIIVAFLWFLLVRRRRIKGEVWHQRDRELKDAYALQSRDGGNVPQIVPRDTALPHDVEKSSKLPTELPEQGYGARMELPGGGVTKGEKSSRHEKMGELLADTGTGTGMSHVYPRAQDQGGWSSSESEMDAGTLVSPVTPATMLGGGGGGGERGMGFGLMEGEQKGGRAELPG